MKVLKTFLLHAMLPEWTHLSEKKYVTENQAPFMNKALTKAIIQRSKLRNLFHKNKLRKIEIIKLSKGIYVFHFCDKIKEFFWESQWDRLSW